MERSSGVLLPVSALPSPHGVGTLGKAAYDFADFLAAAGQRYWQMLPLGPTGFGDSPYSAFSTFAGNPYYIDLDLLTREGLLTLSEAAAGDGGDARFVDYGGLYQSRFGILRTAFERARQNDAAAVAQFALAHPWLPDYALFMALKQQFKMRPWALWPREIRLRTPAALERYRAALQADIGFFSWLQYRFFAQWDALHEYLRSLGIRVIGDLPIYVAPDSADVWAEPENFQLDEDGLPSAVAGVPPDAFTDDGQLWGNPLYNWARMRADGFGWWIRRMEGARRLYDVVRIDHFRGFEQYWSVPAGETTAKNGRWRDGPGMALVGVLRDWFSGLDIIAEDLGVLTPATRALLAESGFPGMKVLEFAFDPDGDGDYLPHNYMPHCVCYIGTHDNAPALAWRESAAKEEIDFAARYFGLNEREGFGWGMLRGGMGSPAALFVAQMQDLLDLGAEARMNTPGTAQGNWRWRLLPGEASPALAERLRRMTALYGRAPKKAAAKE